MSSDRLPDDVVRRIHAHRAQLYSAEWIAERTGLPVATVRRVIGEGKAYPHRPHAEPSEQERRILALRRQGWSHKRIAREVGCVKSTVQRVLARHGDPLPHNAERPKGGGGRESRPPRADPSSGRDEGVPTGERREWDEGEDAATLRGDTGRLVRTEEDVYRVFEVDRARWRIKTWRVKTWEVMAKVGSDKAGYGMEVRQMYGVTAHLERVLKRDVEKALDLVFARFRDAAPVWPKVQANARRDEPFLAVFAICDVHFGKLAWAVETGENYDLKIAETVLRNAVEDLIAENRHRNIQKILFPFGHDWLHVDSRALTTTRGTPQDVDGRFSKVLATAIRGAVSAVEMMAALAPVQVELVPGNHDRTLSECICHVLAARFHNTDRVTVNCDPKTRKYVRFGTNLIGITHGDMVKPDKLPNLMASDAKQDWANTECHEWLIGHGHRSQKWTTQDTNTQNGVVIRMLRALTSTDLWHFDSGYCGQQPGAESYIYGRDRGYSGHSVVQARGG